MALAHSPWSYIQSGKTGNDKNKWQSKSRQSFGLRTVFNFRNSTHYIFGVYHFRWIPSSRHCRRYRRLPVRALNCSTHSFRLRSARQAFGLNSENSRKRRVGGVVPTVVAKERLRLQYRRKGRGRTIIGYGLVWRHLHDPLLGHCRRALYRPRRIRRLV